MYYLSRIGGTLNEVFLGPINKMMDFRGQSAVLHEVSRDATKASFRKGSFTRNVEEICLPASQFIIDVVNNKLKVTVLGSHMENVKTQIFPKIGTSIDIQDAKNVSFCVLLDVFGEEDIGLPCVNILARVVAKAVKGINDGGVISGIGFC